MVCSTTPRCAKRCSACSEGGAASRLRQKAHPPTSTRWTNTTGSRTPLKRASTWASCSGSSAAAEAAELLRRTLQSIPDARNRFDVVACCTELAAKAGDVRVDRTGAHVGAAPDDFEERGPRQDAVPPGHQRLEQTKLADAQGNLVLVDPDAMRARIERQRPDAKDRGGLCDRPRAEEHAYPEQYFANAEGRCDEIIDAHFE